MAFKKGKSGNPGGRPKVVGEVQELARAQTVAAVKTLVSVMGDKKQAASARVSAATAILDRGYGKPAQSIVGDPDNPIQHIHEVIMRGVRAA